MQTTLLGVAIAIILALVTALVGPLFVDWDRYRDTFEARPAAYRPGGAVYRTHRSAWLLPTPSLKLTGHRDLAGRAMPATGARVGCRSSSPSIALMRGGLRAADRHRRRAGIRASVSTRPGGSIGRRRPSVSIPTRCRSTHLAIEDGRVALADAASGARSPSKISSFGATCVPLIGPAKGDGAFVLAGQNYPYRVAAEPPRAPTARSSLHLRHRPGRPAAAWPTSTVRSGSSAAFRISRRRCNGPADSVAPAPAPATPAPSPALVRRQQERAAGGGGRTDRVPIRPGGRAVMRLAATPI